MTFDEAVIRDLKELILPLEQRILGGNVTDFVEYKRMTGVVQGLTRAIEVVQDLANRMKESDG